MTKDLEIIFNKFADLVAEKVVAKLGETKGKKEAKKPKEETTALEAIKEEFNNAIIADALQYETTIEVIASDLLPETAPVMPSVTKPVGVVTVDSVTAKVRALHEELKRGGVPKEAVQQWHREVCLEGFKNLMIARMTQEELDDLNILVNRYTANASDIIAVLLPSEESEGI